MKDEISELLKKEGKLSDKTLDELKDFNIHDFADIVEEIGQEETEYIISSKISEELNTNYIGKNLYVYKEVSSTNTVAKFLAINKVENGSVVISEKQTDARGRSGKYWASPLGGVWLSVILQPHVDYSRLPLITLATGVAVAKALERIGIENAEIKWPNDIMINDKKVCGILTEAVTKFNTIENIIIGVGIDVNIDITEFPEELQEGTTTIANELNGKADENTIIRVFLEELEKIGKVFLEDGMEDILKEWRKTIL